MKDLFTTTIVTYSLPNGKVKSKEISRLLLEEFLIQLKENKCKLISY
jgi:hypothetical protein